MTDYLLQNEPTAILNNKFHLRLIQRIKIN